MNGDSTSKQVDKLNAEQREQIRSYVLSLFALPAIVITAGTFGLGFLVNEWARGEAYQNALTNLTPRITAAAADAAEAVARAEVAVERIVVADTQAAQATRTALDGAANAEAAALDAAEAATRVTEALDQINQARLTAFDAVEAAEGAVERANGANATADATVAQIVEARTRADEAVAAAALTLADANAAAAQALAAAQAATERINAEATNIATALAGNDEFVLRVGGLIASAQLVPSGALVAFDLQECPGTGWAPYTQLAGRFIVGAGLGNGLTNRVFGEEGGAERFRITEAQLPNHAHDMVAVIGNETNTGTIGGQHRAFVPAPLGFYQLAPNTQNTVDGERLILLADATGAAGQGQQVTFMPPYLPLTYCIKVDQ